MVEALGAGGFATPRAAASGDAIRMAVTDVPSNGCTGLPGPGGRRSRQRRGAVGISGVGRRQRQRHHVRLPIDVWQISKHGAEGNPKSARHFSNVGSSTQMSAEVEKSMAFALVGWPSRLPCNMSQPAA